jgi:hypothetical protein
LIALGNNRQAATGHNSRIEMICSYLTSPQFRRHIGLVIETFVDMQAHPDRERRTTMRLWAKREASSTPLSPPALISTTTFKASPDNPSPSSKALARS